MILLPTRRRLAHLHNFFKSYHDTSATMPGMLLIDAADYVDNNKGYLDLKMEIMPRNWSIYITKTESMGDKVREAWGLYKDCAYIGLLNDDHYMITPKWDEILLKHLNGKNMITCNDNLGAKDGKAAGLTLWSGPLMRAVGYIFPPRLQHCFIDDVWELLGRSTGCWQTDMAVLIEHRHISKGHAPEDGTHKAMQGFFHTDGPIYSAWLRYDAGLAISRIRALQDV